MEIKDRLEAMTADLGALTFDRQVRYGADATQRHAHGFSVLCDVMRPVADLAAADTLQQVRP